VGSLGKLVGCVAIVLVGLAGFAGMAVAQDPYPPTGTCSLRVGSAVVSANETHTVSTEHCDAAFASGAQVSHTWSSTPVHVGTATADARGRHSHQYTVPSDATPGPHTITATGPAADGSTLSLSATVTVRGAGGQVGAGAIPFTGSSNALPAVWIALAALVLGSALVIGARRRATVRKQQVLSDS
jgi:hypothetical protein